MWFEKVMIDSNLNVNSTLNVSFLNYSNPLKVLQKYQIQKIQIEKNRYGTEMEPSECEAEITANFLREV